MERLGSHLSGRTQHIDRSILKHGLYSEKNPTGYKIHFLEYPEEMLDEMEQKYIKQYANAGYQLRNVESGGSEGKTDIGERKASKGYYDGIAQGRKNVQKEIAHLFRLHLDFKTKKEPPNKLQEKALQKFKDFLDEK